MQSPREPRDDNTLFPYQPDLRRAPGSTDATNRPIGRGQRYCNLDKLPQPASRLNLLSPPAHVVRATTASSPRSRPSQLGGVLIQACDKLSCNFSNQLVLMSKLHFISQSTTRHTTGCNSSFEPHDELSSAVDSKCLSRLSAAKH